MRVLLQRVRRASVRVADEEKGSIGQGYLALVGIGKDDTTKDLDWMARKVLKLRVFADQQGRMNLDIQQVKGAILSVSQFTLYADTAGGNRPGFEPAAAPGQAEPLWHQWNNLLRAEGLTVEEGVFGADMAVTLINDGPVTIWLDSKV